MSSRKYINWNPDELLLAAELVYLNDYRGLDDSDLRVQDLSKLLRMAGFYRDQDMPPNHRSPASVALKTQNIASTHPEWKLSPTNAGKLDKPALERFLTEPELAIREAQKIRELILLGESQVPDSSREIDFDGVHSHEGRLLKAFHLKRERDPKLREAKLQKTRLLGLPVACEVCGFDFFETYGERGEGFIEVHHILPLHASGPVKSRLDDLALLCSNCHRMIHRKGWITPLALKEIVLLQRTRNHGLAQRP